MMKGTVFLAFSCVLLVAGVSGQCVNTPTSEGLRDLPNGGTACGPLRSGETETDKGKRYLVCDGGRVLTLNCPATLRYDTKSLNCNYASSSTCQLPGSSNAAPQTSETDTETVTIVQPVTTTTKATTTTTTTTIRPTTTTTRRTTTTTRPTTTTTRRTTTTTRPTTTTTRTTTTTTRPPTTTTKRTTTTTTTARPPTANRNPPANSLSQCLDVESFNGKISMQEGDVVCDKLNSGETYADRGKRYIICAARVASIQDCPPPLKLDIKTGGCDWVVDCGGPPTPAPPTTTTTTVKPAPTVKPAVTVTQKITTKPTTTKPTTTKPTTTKPPIPTLKRAPSGSCSPTTCILPDCFCYGAEPVMPLADRPMFIMPTFDDAVTALQYNRFFEPLFVSNNTNIRNPNGCRMRSAYYVSHLDTDYSRVKMLYEAKNEIASHTIHHRLPLGNSVADYPDMVQEIDGLRHMVENQTGITGIRDKIVGFRAPYLRVAGDIMFDVLRDNNFLYDTSVLNINNQKGSLPLWPFTNDYLISDCVNPPCPTKPYPGLWEVPLNGWVGDNSFACSMIDACAVGTNIFTATQLEWEQFYMRNFNTYFYPNKIPQHFFTHGAMFLRSPNSYTAFVQWLKNVLSTHNDVWVVSPKEVIEWMKNPMTNAEMIRTKWGC